MKTTYSAPLVTVYSAGGCKSAAAYPAYTPANPQPKAWAFSLAEERVSILCLKWFGPGGDMVRETH